MTDLKEFEELIKGIDTNRYHIDRTISFSDNKPYISSWSIYRRNMSMEDYLKPENLKVLTSKNNTLEDIKNLIEEEKFYE